MSLRSNMTCKVMKMSQRRHKCFKITEAKSPHLEGLVRHPDLEGGVTLMIEEEVATIILNLRWMTSMIKKMKMNINQIKLQMERMMKHKMKMMMTQNSNLCSNYSNNNNSNNIINLRKMKMRMMMSLSCTSNSSLITSSNKIIIYTAVGNNTSRIKRTRKRKEMKKSTLTILTTINLTLKSLKSLSRWVCIQKRY